jgi:drug/metabolite transporter (DMT)-like permease
MLAGFSPASFLFSFSVTGIRPLAAVGLGLAAATTWGGSDFIGGLGARRAPAILITASGHLITLLALLAVCLLGDLPPPHRTAFLEAAIGGVEGSLALVAFYRALAMGAMGLTAALTGLLTALVPVLFGLWSEGLPTPLAAAGLLLGGLALFLVCYSGRHSPGHNTPPSALLLGAISGIGFGVQLILFKLAARDGVLWALTSARIGGVLGMAAILLFAWPRRPGSSSIGSSGTGSNRQGQGRVWTGFWRIGILAGSLDTLGNLGYTLAAHAGRIDLAATVSSLYPGFTILLAALILRERPTRRQTLGMAVALASVVLLSL